MTADVQLTSATKNSDMFCPKTLRRCATLRKLQKKSINGSVVFFGPQTAAKIRKDFGATFPHLEVTFGSGRRIHESAR